MKHSWLNTTYHTRKQYSNDKNITYSLVRYSCQQHIIVIEDTDSDIYKRGISLWETFHNLWGIQDRQSKEAQPKLLKASAQTKKSVGGIW